VPRQRGHKKREGKGEGTDQERTEPLEASEIVVPPVQREIEKGRKEIACDRLEGSSKNGQWIHYSGRIVPKSNEGGHKGGGPKGSGAGRSPATKLINLVLAKASTVPRTKGEGEEKQKF